MSGCSTIEGIDDVKEFDEVSKAMLTVGLSAEDAACVWQCVAGQPTLTLAQALTLTLPNPDPGLNPSPDPNQARTLVPTLLLPAFGAPADSHTVEWTLCFVAALVPLVLRLAPGLWHVV